MPNIEVQVADAAWITEPDDPESMTRRIVGALFEHMGPAAPQGDVVVRFADDAEVQSLNAQYRGKDSPTNVLSFAAHALPGGRAPALGDIVLARETVEREAASQGKTVHDHAAHLVLHGILHLLGHDHGNDADAEAMESLERIILACIGIDDPYKDDQPMEVSHGA